MAPKKKDEPQPQDPQDAQPALNQERDAPFYVGGPGLDTPVEPTEEPAQPTGVKRIIAGKEYAMDPDTAAAFDQRERDFERRMSQQGTELGELRRIKQQVDGLKAQADPAQPTLDTMLFENPTQALESWWQQKEAKLRQDYQSEQREREFWTQFYKTHRDLDGEDLIVRAVSLRNASALSTITDAGDMSDKIADLSRREILRISQRTKPDTDKSRAVVEGSSISAPKAPKGKSEDEEAKSWSLSKEIRANRQRRREAAARGTKET